MEGEQRFIDREQPGSRNSKMASCTLGLRDYTKLGMQIAMRIDNEEGRRIKQG